jgi:hypothetical protein
VVNCADTSRLKSSSDALTNSSPANCGPEAGDVRPGRRYAENQPRDGLPRCVPDCRYPPALFHLRRPSAN